jgi:uncharacterized protein
MGWVSGEGESHSAAFSICEELRSKVKTVENLLNNRQVFLSRQAAVQFRGFADSQVRRLQGLGTGKKGQRHELIGAHGYDIKAAMYVIRLLNEGIELMRSGVITLPRPRGTCWSRFERRIRVA